MNIDDLRIGQLVENLDGRAFRVAFVNHRDGVVGLQPPPYVDGMTHSRHYYARELERAFRPYWPDTIDLECGGD